MSLLVLRQTYFTAIIDLTALLAREQTTTSLATVGTISHLFHRRLSPQNGAGRRLLVRVRRERDDVTALHVLHLTAVHFLYVET